MPRPDLDRRGVALLEAMIALAILSSAGIATVSLVAAGLRSERGSRERELTIRIADRVLAASTLLSRSDLDQRLGERTAGDLLVRVSRPEPTLYRISVADGARPELDLIVTVVYRPAPTPR